LSVAQHAIENYEEKAACKEIKKIYLIILLHPPAIEKRDTNVCPVCETKCAT
jgi:hypothetical protein